MKLDFVTMISSLGGLIAWFAIVVTGRQPDGLLSFTERYLKVWNRTTAYWLRQTDAYPPFEF